MDGGSQRSKETNRVGSVETVHRHGLLPFPGVLIQKLLVVQNINRWKRA